MFFSVLRHAGTLSYCFRGLSPKTQVGIGDCPEVKEGHGIAGWPCVLVPMGSSLGGVCQRRHSECGPQVSHQHKGHPRGMYPANTGPPNNTAPLYLLFWHCTQDK